MISLIGKRPREENIVTGPVRSDLRNRINSYIVKFFEENTHMSNALKCENLKANCKDLMKNPEADHDVRSGILDLRDKILLGRYYAHSKTYEIQKKARAAMFQFLKEDSSELIEKKVENLRIHCSSLLETSFFNSEFDEEVVEHILSIDPKKIMNSYKARIKYFSKKRNSSFSLNSEKDRKERSNPLENRGLDCESTQFFEAIDGYIESFEDLS